MLKAHRNPRLETSINLQKKVLFSTWSAKEDVPSKLNNELHGHLELTDHRIRGNNLCSSVLLRKEVIQPHLPIRLPCYDFTPIIRPTFGRVLPCGLDYGLRVFPTLMV